MRGCRGRQGRFVDIMTNSVKTKLKTAKSYIGRVKIKRRVEKWCKTEEQIDNATCRSNLKISAPMPRIACLIDGYRA